MTEPIDRLAAMVETMTPGTWTGHLPSSFARARVTNDAEPRYLGNVLQNATEVAVLYGHDGDAHAIAALRNLAPELIAVVRAALRRDERGGHHCRLCGGWHAARWFHDAACPMLALDEKLAALIDL